MFCIYHLKSKTARPKLPHHSAPPCYHTCWDRSLSQYLPHLPLKLTFCPTCHESWPSAPPATEADLGKWPVSLPHLHVTWLLGNMQHGPSTLKLVPSLGCLQPIASCLWPFLLCHLCCLLHGSASVHPLYVDCAGGPGTLFFSIHPLSQVISMNHRLTFNMTYTPMTLNVNVQPWGTFLGSIYMNRNLKLLMESQNEHFKADFFNCGKIMLNWPF